MIKALAAALSAALLGIATPGLAQDDMQSLLADGEYLTHSKCLSCHRLDGTDVGIPGINCLTRKEFIDALVLYKTGLRTNPVMVSLASSLNERQMRALAEYWSKMGTEKARCPPALPAAGR